jgi:hypothetical protein
VNATRWDDFTREDRDRDAYTGTRHDRGSMIRAEKLA